MISHRWETRIELPAMEARDENKEIAKEESSKVEVWGPGA